MRMVLLSQKTEVKQRGPGLPQAAQTKRMLWGRTVDSFWSKKLVDQDGTVDACVFIGGSRSSLAARFYFPVGRLDMQKCQQLVPVAF